jgi:RimJ/RimL family protein N-acetyltransferase
MATLAEALLTEVPETLETERLRLRATRAGMGAKINEAYGESFEALGPWMPWARGPQTVADSEKHCREAQAKWFARQELDFCFHRKDNDSFVGKGGLHTINWAIPKFEIGYWIRSSCARQGMAAEATLALVSLAVNRLGARRLEIATDARNLPSRRVAEKCGFTLEGTHRRSRLDNAGELADFCMYARIP